MRQKILLLLLLNSFALQAQQLALPAKQYLLAGVENRMYIQTFVKNAHAHSDIVRFEGDVEYARAGQREKYSAITNPTEGSKIEVRAYDAESFEVSESHTMIACVAESIKINGEVVVQFLGDSFTRGCYFKDAFLERGYVPNVKLVGTRRVADHAEHYHEGRGGWTLSDYFSNKGRETFFNPYYQPAGGLRYWGSTWFWQQAVLIEKNGGKALSSFIRYECGDFDAGRFGDDGLLIAPQKGDMMYCPQRGEYIEWSGRQWKKMDEPSEWSFDYTKYLEMWGIEKPQFLVVMLGLNDFRDLPLPLDFKVWNEQMELLLNSYRKAVPTGRLLLSTPCTSCGTLDNDRGFFTLRQNATMWYVRDNIIRTFDKREAEGIYVVDASITIDNEGGYNMKNGLQTGNPHPYPNYPALGVPIAACVQYYR